MPCVLNTQCQTELSYEELLAPASFFSSAVGVLADEDEAVFLFAMAICQAGIEALPPPGVDDLRLLMAEGLGVSTEAGLGTMGSGAFSAPFVAGVLVDGVVEGAAEGVVVGAAVELDCRKKLLGPVEVVGVILCDTRVLRLVSSVLSSRSRLSATCFWLSIALGIASLRDWISSRMRCASSSRRLFATLSSDMTVSKSEMAVSNFSVRCFSEFLRVSVS